jgi:large subunit ribosomal protein L5e
MGFIKVVKNKAYFKRYQVKYRRRREGKTDYRARKRLITQDKNKYNSPKYRFVVRFTNKDIICQIIYAKITGDFVLAAAYAHELKRYGFPVAGNTNYASAYATGLLLARRLLTKLKLADTYQGQKVADGNVYHVEAAANKPAPFRALLDVGLRRTTTGAKLFAALKGACDGGLDVPHGERRFVGYSDEEKKLDAEVLRKHILGQHVADYMKSLKEENPTRFDKQFAAFTKAGLTADNLASTWTKVHAAIRANPAAQLTTKKVPAKQKHYQPQRRSLAQRKDRVRQKMAARAKKAGSASE